MLYYRVKQEADQTRIYKFAKGGGLRIDNFLIANELKTAAELKKLLFNALGTTELKNCFELVEINKNKTFWCFGARFEA